MNASVHVGPVMIAPLATGAVAALTADVVLALSDALPRRRRNRGGLASWSRSDVALA
jgi:hypothetical protein